MMTPDFAIPRWPLGVLVASLLVLVGGCLSPAFAQSIPQRLALTEPQQHVRAWAAQLRAPAVAPRIEALEVPDTLRVGEEAPFGALVNVDAASLPLRFTWRFGDDARARSLHVRHAFDAPGAYPVTLTVENPHGIDRASAWVVVEPAEARRKEPAQ